MTDPTTERYKKDIRKMFDLTDATGFEKIIDLTPAYDKRDKNPSKNYGIGSVQIRFVLKGKKGAIQFLVGTDWYLSENQKEMTDNPLRGASIRGIKPDGWDVGYHSPKPMFDGQTSMGPCQYLDGKECYYDGSSLRADDWVEKFLLPGGSEAVWKEMIKEYESTFESDTE